MFKRQTQGSVVCPSCGRLVGVRDDRCLICGARNPGMWGFAKSLRLLGGEAAMANILAAACVSMFVASIAVAPSGVKLFGGFDFVRPDQRALYLLGGSGANPVFGLGHWWTVLSASLLHGGLLHLAFNLSWLRSLLPEVANLLGSGRTVLIWTASSICGFLASSVMGLLLPGVPFVGGGSLTVGASAPIFGLFGALIAYTRATGQRAQRKLVWSWVIAGAVFGMVMPFIDNWAHAGGFVGGAVAARLLKPLESERPGHVLAALVCLVATLAAVGLSAYRVIDLVQS